MIQHRPGRRHCNEDALSRLPVPPGGCGTRLDVHPGDLPCGGCPKCKRPHDNWDAFAEVVNDVGLLSKPGCWSCEPDMGSSRIRLEISEADAGGEESGADLTVESVIRQPSISEITLGYVKGGGLLGRPSRSIPRELNFKDPGHRGEGSVYSFCWAGTPCMCTCWVRRPLRRYRV